MYKRSKRNKKQNIMIEIAFNDFNKDSKVLFQDYIRFTRKYKKMKMKYNKLQNQYDKVLEIF